MTDDIYLIEKDIPIPAQGYRKGLTEAIQRMEVGDSFLVPSANTQRLQILKAAQRHDIHVITRTVAEGKLRVWRVDADHPDIKINKRGKNAVDLEK